MVITIHRFVILLIFFLLQNIIKCAFPFSLFFYSWIYRVVCENFGRMDNIRAIINDMIETTDSRNRKSAGIAHVLPPGMTVINASPSDDTTKAREKYTNIATHIPCAFGRRLRTSLNLLAIRKTISEYNVGVRLDFRFRSCALSSLICIRSSTLRIVRNARFNAIPAVDDPSRFLPCGGFPPDCFPAHRQANL